MNTEEKILEMLAQIREERSGAVNEGIDAILAQLTPNRRVEEMEADITVLKTAVEMLTQEVAELKKAQ